MLRTIGIGVWAAAVALGAAYATVAMTREGPAAAAAEAQGIAELEYRRPPPITVPMITDGKLRGYVVTRVVFTVDPAALARLPFAPEPFVVDEAFRRIYTDGRIEFDHMSRYNLDDITTVIRTNVNERLGLDLVHDVLLDELSYVDKRAAEAKNESG